MKIKITESKKNELRSVISETEGRSVVNRVSVEDLMTFADMVEKKLDRLDLPKKYRIGALYVYRGQGPFAKAYKFGQPATLFEIERGSDLWYLVKIERVKVYPKQRARSDLYLSRDQKEKIVNMFFKNESIFEIPEIPAENKQPVEEPV
jgi:hypothetical protein